ncbi:HEAT repeat domain-containing protein [Psychrobacillus sp. FSL H8-0483]|uniref:HEAT repeat domain-containing protein n=1 Tax=Psychrobacillus sp. FSL H8-0483 TaxID=2921389 RepID=UPI00315A56F7
MNGNFQYFYYTIIALLAFQLLLLLVLSIRKIIRNKRSAKEEQIYQENLELFVDYLFNDENLQLPVQLANPKNIAVAERIFSETFSTVNDDRTKQKLQEAAIAIFSSTYLKRLKKGSWSTRVNTLYYIEDFQIVSLLPYLQKRFHKLNAWDEEKNQLIRTLAALNDTSIIHYLNANEDSQQHQYLDVFNRLSEEQFDNSIEICYEDNHQTSKLAILNFIGLSKKTRYQALLENTLLDEQSEVRIQSLKGLYRLNYMENIALLEPFFASSSWEERMFSVKIIGAIMIENYESQLIQLLGDSVWWVRNASAEALLSIFGEEKLKELAAEHSDIYARDMAKQWLSSGKRGG